MKIVQKILSHGLLIAFFVAVFFIYLYRGELFPQWFDEQAQTEVAPSEPGGVQAPVAGAGQLPAEQAAAPQEAGQPEPQPAAAVSTEAGVAAVDKPVIAEAAPATAGASPQDRPVEPQQAATTRTHPVADVATAPDHRPGQAAEAAPPAVGDDANFQSKLDQARQLYWRRDLRAAEQAYRRLTESHPQRAEAWGELGNLYFNQREMVQAADVYHRAINLLIEQGDTGRARQMLGAMQQLDSDRARKLEARLSQSGQ